MKFYFAPLEGITGYTYRNAFIDLFGGMDKYYAPFVSPSVNDRLKGKEIRDLKPENNKTGYPLIPQMLVNRPDYFIRTANQLEELGYVDEININLGCPSGTVCSKNKGAGFLRQPEEMIKFFDSVFEWNNEREKPYKISVKTRIGYYEPDEIKEILTIYNRYPISELIVHPRTRNQMYKEVPDMDWFIYVLENSNNPVCYNGDINTIEDYKRITEMADIDSVMIGRGLIANPYLVHEIKGQGRVTLDIMKKYHDRLYDDFSKMMKSDKHQLFKMKEMWNYMAKTFEDEHKCAKKIRKTQNLYRYHQEVDDIFNNFTLKKQETNLL